MFTVQNLRVTTIAFAPAKLLYVNDFTVSCRCSDS